MILQQIPSLHFINHVKIIILFIACFKHTFLFSQSDSGAFVFKKPKPFSFITKVPSSFIGVVKSPFQKKNLKGQKKNLKGTAVVIGATALLIVLDQPIYDGVRKFSDNIHLHPKEENNVLWSIKGNSRETVLFKTPGNLNTGLYMLGHWFPSIALAGGLWLHGKIENNNRSLQTASDIIEAYLTQSLATQIVKRISGRESPLAATSRGGTWRPFVSFSDYKNNRAKYDAFSSGHLATMMATITILANNYPEKKWIKPVGYSLMGLCGFSMINNGEHWAGDFPLGIAIGYISGKIITNRHKNKTAVNTIAGKY